MLAAESGTNVFHAIADPTRRSLLKLLANKEMSIASISDYYHISRIHFGYREAAEMPLFCRCYLVGYRESISVEIFK